MIMNLEEVWLSKFRLDRKSYRKELLVIDQEKSNGSKNIKFKTKTSTKLQRLSHY